MVQFAQFRLRLSPQETLYLPARNKGNVLRGALGTMLRRLCCHPQCPGAARCEHRAVCPYALVFEPAAPPGVRALSNYEAIPRPFVIRPPLATENGAVQIVEKTRYEPGEILEFGLILVGRSIELLPHFVQAFERLGEEGFGLNRARCRLERVEQIETDRSALHIPHPAIVLRFLTPTHLVAGGKAVRRPEFHHLVCRLRDRLNALATFYCGGPLDLDFRGLAARAGGVRCVRRDLRWEARARLSTRTGRRHPIGGFVGECEFAADSPDALAEFLPLLDLGQHLHVGKHAAFGNGWLQLEAPAQHSETPDPTQWSPDILRRL